MEKKGLRDERLGVTSLDGASLGALGELGIHTFDAQSLLFEARAVKTEDEINCLKRAQHDEYYKYDLVRLDNPRSENELDAFLSVVAPGNQR